MLERIFDVFSRRQKDLSDQRKPLTEEFRNRVLMTCKDMFGEDGYELFLMEMYKQFQYLLGRANLSNSDVPDSAQDLLLFLTRCSDENFLDFLEYIFKYKNYRRYFPNENDLVDIINELFLLDDLPYEITKFVREKRIAKGAFQGNESQPLEAHVLVSYPKIICRENQLTHSSAIRPALNLLTDKSFTSANQEILEALEDYRKEDYGDCLTKCCSSFESTMKIICDRKGWSYNPQSDTASQLLETIFENSKLEKFFKEPLKIVATLRNRLSKSHGSGSQRRIVPKHKAKYTINATASAILLLVEECL